MNSVDINASTVWSMFKWMSIIITILCIIIVMMTSETEWIMVKSMNTLENTVTTYDDHVYKISGWPLLKGQTQWECGTLMKYSLVNKYPIAVTYIGFDYWLLPYKRITRVYHNEKTQHY